MGLFKHKKEEVPELPTLSSLEDNNFNFGVIPESPPGFGEFGSQERLGMPPIENKTLPNLPFPRGQDFNQEMIKRVVTNNNNNNLLPRDSMIRPIIAEPFNQDDTDEFRAKEFSEESVPVKRYSDKKAEPIYIRLDKFETICTSSVSCSEASSAFFFAE